MRQEHICIQLKNTASRNVPRNYKMNEQDYAKSENKIFGNRTHRQMSFSYVYLNGFDLGNIPSVPCRGKA